jgi:hypothetical protein
MRLPTNNWRYRRTEHRFYAEIVTDIKTRTELGLFKESIVDKALAKVHDIYTIYNCSR